MKKVYLVEEMCDSEHGCCEVVKVFANEADAEAYVEANQEYEQVWWRDDDVAVFSYREEEVE